MSWHLLGWSELEKRRKKKVRIKKQYCHKCKKLIKISCFEPPQFHNLIECKCKK